MTVVSALVDSLWFESIPEPNTGCWVWMGTDPGAVRQLRARVWNETHGPVPSDHAVDLACRLESCVNPAHLKLSRR